MHIGSSQNNFKKRRKESINLKPVNPISLKSDTLIKFLKNISCCFRRKEKDDAESGNGNSVTVVRHSNLAVSQKEQRDLTPLLREITTNFFENNYYQYSEDTHQHLDKNKSESSLCTCNPISCRRKKSKRLSRNSIVNNTNSDVGLEATRECISASAFLTTSFFSLSHKPEYSTYPIHINLHYAEDHPSDSNKSSQYCEKDFEEINKNAKTSTRGLQCFSDNSTQSEYMSDYVDYLAENITQKVAHFFEITPPKRNKVKQQREKAIFISERVNKATSASIPSPLEEEPTLLYVNSIKHFVSTDDTTVESKLGFDDERSKSIYRERKVLRPHTTRPLLTKNCCTSTSETCICSEMCPKFKEWYEFLQNNMRNHNANFRHFGQLKNISSSKVEITNEKEESENCCLPEYIVRNNGSATDANINKAIDCKEVMRELSELETSFNNYDNFAAERNLLDILNQRYPTFIGFQFNNSESRKLTYSINKKTIPPNRKKRVPKIIIREKKKRSSATNNSKNESESKDNAKQNDSNSRASVMNVATNNVFEIREIIESLLPKDPSKFKMISSEYLEKSESNQKIDRLNKSNSKQDELLQREVEKIVDELLDEVPSTSRDIEERSEHLADFKQHTYDGWTLKDDSSLSSLDIELSSLGENVDSAYSGRRVSQTVVPLFHKLKMQTPKKNRPNDNIKFHLVEDIKSETFDKVNTAIKNTNGSPDTSPIKSERKIMQQLKENNFASPQNEPDKESLSKSFYAQIIQKTASAEHPLIRTKLSQSSSKSSLNSFMKNLLICLKYNESKSKVQNTYIQSNDYTKNSSSAKTSTNKQKSIPLKKSSSISTPVSSGTFTDWKEKKLLSISAEPEKIDKSNMFSQETSTVGVQVFIAKHVKDKEVPSSFPKHKRKYAIKRDICTQTRPGPKVIPCTHRTSMQSESSSYKQKGDTTHPSSANKKVNENGACSENVRIFSTPVVQEINPTENNQNSNTFSTQSDSTFDLRFPTVQNNLKDIRQRKSCNLLSLFSNTSSSWLPFKTHSDGTIPANFDITSLITPSLTSSLSKREMKHRFSNQLCKNSSSTVKPALCSDSGSGDTENNMYQAPSCEHAILPPQGVKQIVLSVHNTSQTAFFKGNSVPGEVPSQMTFPHNSSGNLSTGSNSATKLLYEANDLSDRQLPPSEKTLVSPENNSTVKIKEVPNQLISNPSLTEDYSDESTESDIYKFKPTEIVIDDMYLERIRHLWLKSGLRQHLSRLSNLELKPVHEWRKLALLETEEPVPVLEKLDVEPIPTHTEKVRITQHEPIPDSQKEKSEESLLADMKKEAEKLDKCVLPTLFNKLIMSETDQKFEIQLSSSSSEEGTIEPALANVGPSLEKLDNEFIDWVIRLGIPLAKISLQEVQTSQEYLPKKGKHAPKFVKDKGCRCDNEAFDGKYNEIESLNSVLPESHTTSTTYVAPEETKSTHSELRENLPRRNNYYENEQSPVLSQPTITSEINLKTASTQSHGKPPRFLISKEDVQKEILNILDDVINKLQYKVQEETLKLTSTQDQKGLKATGTFRGDYCELKNLSVSFKKHNIAKIDEESIEDSAETSTTGSHERKPSILKQLKKYVQPAKHEPATVDSIDSTYPSNSTSTIEKILGEKLYASCSKAEAKLSQKLGISGSICLYKPRPSSDKRYANKNKLSQKIKVQIKNKIDNTKSAGTQIKTSTSRDKSSINQLVNKYWFEKCYCDLLAGDIKNQNIFGIKSNYNLNENCTGNRLNSFVYASGHNDLGTQHQTKDLRISKDCCLCLYNFEKHRRKRNTRNTSQTKKRNRCKSRPAYQLSDKIQTKNMCPAFNNSSNTWNDSIRFAANIQNSTTAKSVRQSVSNKGNPELDVDLKECLLFAITSLTKLLTRFCAKFNCSDLVNYYSDIQSQICDRNISISSLTSSTHIIGNVNRPCEKNMLSITKSVSSSSKSETSSRGYFSDTSFGSKNASISPIPSSNDSKSEKLLYSSGQVKHMSSVNYNGDYVIRADNVYSFKYNTGKSIMNSPNISSTNTSRETMIRRSLDDFFYNVLYSSSTSELSKNSHKSYTEACRSTYSFVDSKWSRIHLLIQQYKTCIESEKLSDTEINSNNVSYLSEIRENSSDGCNYSNDLGNYPKPSTSNDSLDLDDVDDVWEIIKLLSKLCPRVLCKYYVKRIFS